MEVLEFFKLQKELCDKYQENCIGCPYKRYCGIVCMDEDFAKQAIQVIENFKMKER